MVESITKETIAAGEALIKKLNQSGIRPKAVFWFYYPERERYQLVISIPEARTEGSKKFYRKILSILEQGGDELGEITLEDVTLQPPLLPMRGLIRLASKIERGVPGYRLHKTGVDGDIIDDAYLYRLR